MTNAKRDYTRIYIDGWGLAVASLFSARDKEGKASISDVLLLFLQRIRNLGERFNTKSMVITWDDRHLLRTKLLPGYRDNVLNTRDAVMETYEYLPALQEALASIGFMNQFFVPEMEYLDIVAHFLNKHHDMSLLVFDHVGNVLSLSLLNKTTDYLAFGKIKYHNNRPYTLQDFVSQFGIVPDQWKELVSYKGNSWSGIKGVPKMGYKAALMYLNGEELPRYTDAMRVAYKDYTHQVLNALKAPLMPLSIELREDAFSIDGCAETFKKHGLVSEFEFKFWQEIDK